MKKVVSSIAIFLAVIMMVTVFTACGQQAVTDQKEQTQTQTQAPASTSEPEKTTASKKIQFQYIGGTIPEFDESIQKLIDVYSKDTGNEVETIFVNWGNAYQQFVNSMMAGIPADIVELGGVWPVEFVDKGAFASVDDYLPKEIVDNFIPNGFDAMTGSDGKRYGLPWDGSTWGLFYRKDLFEEAGLDPNSPPKNWDELIEYAKKLTKPDGSQYGLMIPTGGWEPDAYLNQFMWQSGNEIIIKKDDTTIGNFNTPEGLRAAQLYYDLTNTYKVMPKEVTGMMWEPIKNAFVEGKTAMMYGGMWVINNIRTGNPELDGKWASAQAPEGPGGKVCLGYPNTMHITAQSKVKEDAAKLLEYIYRQEDGQPSEYKKLMVIVGVHSWEKDFANTVEWAKDPLNKPFVDQAEWGHNRPLFAKYEQFRKMFYVPAIQSMVSGDLKPQQFVEQMDEAIEKLVIVP